MWYPFMQRNKTAKRAVGMEFGGDGGGGQNLKKGSRQYRGVFIKRGVIFFKLLYLESVFLSVAYFTVANLVQLGISVHC